MSSECRDRTFLLLRYVLRRPRRAQAPMKLGVFTPVFGTLKLDEVLVEGAGAGARARRSSSAPAAGRAAIIIDVDALLDKPCAADYRKMIADAGLTISALSCHGNPLHPDRGDRARPPTTCSARRCGSPSSSRCRSSSRSPAVRAIPTAPTHPNWVTAPWPPEFLDDPRVAVGEEGDSMLARRRARSPPTTASRSRSRRIPASSSTTSTARSGCAQAARRRTSASTSIRAISSGRASTCPTAIRALGDSIFHVHAKDVALDPQNVAVNGVIDTKTYRRMAERSWLFRSVGWGHDELEWKRIVSALRLAGYDYVMSIEHEDALASVDEGLRAAVDLLSRVILTEPPVEAWWT